MCTHKKKLYKFLELKDFERWIFLNVSMWMYHWLCYVCQLWVCTLKYWKTNISTARYTVYSSLYIFSSVSPTFFSKLNRFDIRIRIFYHIQYHFISVCVRCSSRSMYSNWISDDIQIPIVWLGGQNEAKKLTTKSCFPLVLLFVLFLFAHQCINIHKHSMKYWFTIKFSTSCENREDASETGRETKKTIYTLCICRNTQ